MNNQNLFEALQRVCGFTALESDMAEIITAYEKDLPRPALSGEVTGDLREKAFQYLSEEIGSGALVAVNEAINDDLSRILAAFTSLLKPQEPGDAVEFAEWIVKKEWEYVDKLSQYRNKKGIVVIKYPTSPLYQTTQELYELFKKEKYGKR